MVENCGRCDWCVESQGNSHLMIYRLINADVMDGLRTLADQSIQTCVTSPPYWGLRDYGIEPSVWGGDPQHAHEWGSGIRRTGGARGQGSSSIRLGRANVRAQEFVRDAGNTCECGAWRGCLGLEPTPELFVRNIVLVFREVWRVLRDDGTLWINLGDSYTSGGRDYRDPGKSEMNGGGRIKGLTDKGTRADVPSGMKAKDLVGIPWMVAFALRVDGWYLRSDIIWCLSGGTWVYARTASGGITLSTIKDLARLDPTTIELWNGERWTRVLGMSKSKRKGDELEIVLRSGERIACTPTHRFPTQRGVIEAGNLRRGDALVRCQLPEPDAPRDCALDVDAAWFAGLYLAEGSLSGDTIQIAGHAKESERWRVLQHIAKKFGGTATRTVAGNKMDIRLHGRVLLAIIDELVTGRTAIDKGFSPSVWRYSNRFVAAMLDGYLSGDGHYDAKNRRWRLGFCRNYNLELDIRTACARLGYTLTLNLSTARYQGGTRPSFRGELRMERSGHHNERDSCQVVAINRARCRDVYDIGVADEPHLFALASGILTHNSKPNPMPESVRDRPTKAHEYLFLLAKSERYFYDGDAIREPASFDAKAPAGWDTSATGSHGSIHKNGRTPKGNAKTFRGGGAYVGNQSFDNGADVDRDSHGNEPNESGTRNKRSVWTVATAPFHEAHFATFPPDLIEPCILAGTSPTACGTCGAPWKRVTETPSAPDELYTESRNPNDEMVGRTSRRGGNGQAYQDWRAENPSRTLGWEPTCDHDDQNGTCRVLDPFSGSGTTGEVALSHQRDYVGIERSAEYVEMSRRRLEKVAPMFAREESQLDERVGV